MTAEQYWTSSLAELSEMLQGRHDSEQRLWRRTAWMTAHLLNASGKSLKRDVTADDLLGLTHEKRKRLDAQVRADQEAEHRKRGEA